MLINYADETLAVLKSHDYSIDDIDWIGTYDFTIPITEFFIAARNTNYDNGFGVAAIPLDIVIVMKDGCWFEREEYDGSEWWAYKTPYKKPMIHLHMQQNNFEYYGYLDPVLDLYCVKTNE